MSEKTGIDLLRACVRLADMSNENAFYLHYGQAPGPFQTVGFSAVECLKLLVACIDSDWDICPSDLETPERQFAAKHGKLSVKTVVRLRKKYG